MTASAPSSFATSSRRASFDVPVMMMPLAPADFAAITQHSPCWPGPWMRTVEPNPTPPSSNVHWIPFDIGVAIPASSGDNASGTRCSTAFNGR
jgi:hypothetical protein